MAETGESDGLHPGAALEHVEVDERPRLQSQLERVSAELRVVAQPAAESGKRPPERSQRVVRLGEEEACEALARRREPRAQEVGEQAPRFVAPWGLHGSAIPFDSGRAQKVDAQAHRPLFLVTRVVTRLTVTLLAVEFKPSERKGANMRLTTRVRAARRSRERSGACGRGAGDELRGLGRGPEDRRDRGQQLRAEHAVPGRLSDSVSGRAQPVHRLDPPGRRRPAGHLGRPPGQQGRSVGSARESR